MSFQQRVKLTKITLFLPALFCQTGQFFVFIRQLEFAVIKAGLSGETFLSQTPVGGQQHLSVHLKVLQLKKFKKVWLMVGFPPNSMINNARFIMHVLNLYIGLLEIAVYTWIEDFYFTC